MSFPGNQEAEKPGTAPALSLIFPFYDEEANVRRVVKDLVGILDHLGTDYELFLVNNGSRDRTGELIRDLARVHPEIVAHRVEVNEGYGNGVLSAIPLARAAWVGIIPCDGQVDAEDVVRLFKAARASSGRVLAKVRRRFRMDGLRRKLISIAYQVFVRMLWPGLETIDVNGSPKIVPRDRLVAMQLESKGWLLDPELMIKAYYAGLRVLELNVFGRMRGAGLSHVRASTCWEFVRALVGARVSGCWRPALPLTGPAPARSPLSPPAR